MISDNFRSSRFGCKLLRCCNEAYATVSAPSEELCSIHHAMFHLAPEGQSYGEIAAGLASSIQTLSLTERFKLRQEIRKWEASAHDRMRAEVVKWTDRIELQFTKGCTK